MKRKAIELRKVLKDRNAQLQCDTQIRESQRYIDYFSEELRRLQTRGNRASFISLQPPIINSQHTSPTSESSSTESNTTSPVVGVTQQPLYESPTQTIQSYFSNSNSNSVSSTEEEESRRRYTNLGNVATDIII